MGPDEESVRSEMVRSEERLRVRVQRVPYERVVIRRVVVTEEQTITVLLRREELRLERTPVTDPAGSLETDVPGASAPSDPHVLELVLHREVADVGVTTVPYERVSVVTEVVTGLERVSGDVRAERVVFETRPTLRPDGEDPVPRSS